MTPDRELEIAAEEGIMTTLVIKTDSPVVAGPLQGHWTAGGLGRRSRMTATAMRSSMECSI
jgi:hypothetical protein